MSLSAVAGNTQSELRSTLKKLPMAGLEPARAFYGSTDFKSVGLPIEILPS
jgi:hypothetical protein